MNKSELWEMVSEEKMKQVVAGYKSNATRKMNLVSRKAQREKITREYQEKIDNYIESVRSENLAAKRHNAAVKANATRRGESLVGSETFCRCSMRTSKTK